MSLVHNDRSDWNLAKRIRALGFAQRFLHQQFVGVGHLPGPKRAVHNKPSAFLYCCFSMILSMLLARPVTGSQSINAAQRRTSSVAGSKRDGMLVRNFCTIRSFCTPITPA